MPQWIDLALLSSEEALASSIQNLSPAETDKLLADVTKTLGESHDQIQKQLLRVLVERARPLALPADIWKKSPADSIDFDKVTKAYMNSLYLQPTPDRLEAARKLFVQFHTERKPVSVTKVQLEDQDFRCTFCGLAFCNNDLDQNIKSTHGWRRKLKIDPFKPHWGDAKYLVPTNDHLWNVAGFGSNDSFNVRVACFGCNQAKKDYMAAVQMPSHVGIVKQGHLKGKIPISFELFFAQIWRSPKCENTSRGPDEIELTVELRNPAAALTFDNLRTVESPGVSG